MTRTLILGGARSGKSGYAERCAAATGRQVVYIATGTGGDEEMRSRIAHHQQRRPADWIVVEEPVELGAALMKWCTPDHIVIVDCLTLWLTNLLFSGAADYPDVGPIPIPDRFYQERARFLQALTQAAGDLILVSNEVGMGIVPYGAISRCFTDEAGRLNQDAAQCCDRAVLVVAGLPLILKGAAC